MKNYYRVLTIAGSDSGGGAGIQADLKTFSALGCYGMSVITALTAQNTQTVRAIHPVPAEFIGEQIDTVIEDIGVDAIKIGMLFSPEVIHTVSIHLQRYNPPNIVLDPVMVAKSGDKLLRDEAIETLKGELVPIATVITPNHPEAGVLLGRTLTDSDAAESICEELGRLGAAAVLLKGGHMEGETSSDYLFSPKDRKISVFEAKRVKTRNTHGTGCTLSSAIASYLARGFPLEEAVKEAKDYLTNALLAGADYQLGQGHGPVHHFYRFWQ